MRYKLPGRPSLPATHASSLANHPFSGKTLFRSATSTLFMIIICHIFFGCPRSGPGGNSSISSNDSLMTSWHLFYDRLETTWRHLPVSWTRAVHQLDDLIGSACAVHPFCWQWYAKAYLLLGNTNAYFSSLISSSLSPPISDLILAFTFHLYSHPHFHFSSLISSSLSLSISDLINTFTFHLWYNVHFPFLI